MAWIYLSNDEMDVVEYRRKVNHVQNSSLAPFAGYDADGDAAFDVSDPVERMIVQRVSGEEGLELWPYAGDERPAIMDKRD